MIDVHGLHCIVSRYRNLNAPRIRNATVHKTHPIEHGLYEREFTFKASVYHFLACVPMGEVRR